MTSSETSTDRGHAGRDGIQPWHFFMLLAMAGATWAVLVSRDTHIATLLLLSAAVLACGLAALALHHAFSSLLARPSAFEAMPVSGRVRAELERDKALILRSLKELEFDREMKKISESDFAELSKHLRSRALEVIKELDRGVRPPESPTAVVAPGAAVRPASTSPTATAVGQTCPSCRTGNDVDARFCKECGARLA